MSHQPPTLTLTEGPRPGAGSPLVRGATLGRYVVLDLLGSGGMGVVYAAYDFGLDRRVCVKLVRDAKDSRSAERQERLLREARAAARISHPHVVTVHDVGTWEDHVFVAMELVEGGTLRRWLRAADRTQAQILDAFTQAGRGLAAAHAAGLVHRDFKPDNVLVGADGRVRVTDFGLARDALVAAPTDAGHTSGTPAYMAPEQHRGEPATAASDQYSFALSLYEALFHASPYPATEAEALYTCKAQGRFAPPPARSGVPSGLRTALLRALAPDRAHRHPSMEALLLALRPQPRARKLALLGAGAGASLAAAAAAVAMLSSGDSTVQAQPPALTSLTRTRSAQPAPEQCAPASPAPLTLPVASLASAERESSEEPSTRPAPATFATFATFAAPAARPVALRQRSTPAPPSAQRPAPPFTVRLPEEQETEGERPAWVRLLSQLEEALETLGLLEPGGDPELALLATASLPAGGARTQAESLLGRYGQVLAGEATEQVHHPLSFGPGSETYQQSEIHRLEEALSGTSDPVEAAKLQFDLARLLYTSDTQRALELARTARETLRAQTLASARDLLVDLEDWLDDHGRRIRPLGQ